MTPKKRPTSKHPYHLDHDKPRDTFAFHLHGVNAGWLDATMVVNGVEHRFEVSYLRNAQGELMEVVRELLAYFDKGYAYSTAEEIELNWTGEPWHYRFVFFPVGPEALRITYFHLSDSLDKEEKPEERFEAIIHADAFFLQVYEQMKGLLVRHGFLGYRNRWNYADFPLGDFIRYHHELEGSETYGEGLAADVVFLQKLLTHRTTKPAMEIRIIWDKDTPIPGEENAPAQKKPRHRRRPAPEEPLPVVSDGLSWYSEKPLGRVKRVTEEEKAEWLRLFPGLEDPDPVERWHAELYLDHYLAGKPVPTPVQWRGPGGILWRGSIPFRESDKVAAKQAK